MDKDHLRVLEIRVHGVRATQPWESLGLDDADKDQPCNPRPPGIDVGASDGKTGVYCCCPGHKPPSLAKPGLHVEAYSWGSLTSVPKRFGEAVVRSLWLLLAPFAFVNVAMWSRPRLAEPGPVRAITAVMIRWAGLLLTCLMVATVCGIAIDLVAWQCFRHGNTYCADILSPIFGRQPAVERMALASAFPLIALLGLLFLSWQTFRKTEAKEFSQPLPPTKPDPIHVLRRRGFWSGKERVFSLMLLHLAGGLCIISVSITAPVHAIEGAVFWPVPLPFGAAALVLLAVFVCGALGVLDQTEYEPSSTFRRVRHHGPRVLGVLSAGVLLADIIWLWSGHQSLNQSRQLPFTPDIQIAITGCLFALVFLLAAVLTAAWFAWVSLVIIGSFFALHLLSPGILRENFPPFLALLAAAYLTGLLVHFRARKDGPDFMARKDRGDDVSSWAWFGLAPAHLLAFAIFLGVMYSTVATLLSASFLNGRPFDPAALTQSTPSTPSGDLVSGESLTVPSPFLWFSMCFLPGLVFASVTAAALILYFFARGAVQLRELADQEESKDSARVRKSRFWAAVVHRVEALLGAVALVPLSAGVLAAAGMLSGQEPMWPWLVTAGLWAAAISGVLVAVLIFWTIYHEELQRTIGVLWDISTFWPRTAHPFSPPCYGERVVPELVDRVRAGLSGIPSSENGEAPCIVSDPESAAAHYHYVILSGHSLGSAILAAVILQLSDFEIGRIRFVSYGSQLRAWFARFFPDLLGPDILGHEKSVRPEFWNSAPDAPLQERNDEFKPPKGSLSRLLGGNPHWRNYFRRNDQLGFRVFQDAENDIDHRLSEWEPVDPRKVVAGKSKPMLHTHGRYQESDAYRDLVHGWIDGAKPD